jgi:hypothetical protein
MNWVKDSSLKFSSLYFKVLPRTNCRMPTELVSLEVTPKNEASLTPFSVVVMVEWEKMRLSPANFWATVLKVLMASMTSLSLKNEECRFFRSEDSLRSFIEGYDQRISVLGEET